MKPTKKMKTKLSEIEKAFKALNSITLTEDNVPEGWFTRKEFQDKAGCAENTAAHKIGKLVKMNMLDVKMFRIKCGNNVRKIPHYKMKT
jgi:hypothetical protein